MVSSQKKQGSIGRYLEHKQHSHPLLEHKQLVVFKSCFEQGFGLPCLSFFGGLLFYYGFELINLNPNSILHIAIFIYLCEAFLCVRPHFYLFCHLFVLRPLPSINDLEVIGSTGLQLRSKSAYLDVPLVTTNKY